ncbi:MAG: pyridoxal phosphate-dependent aminotransferase, partial [Syntrophomonadaceae bacterium]|nr:pyridoxal phosphate-dependent aminotransferase [Syntrophomonadaceae bacterium]
AKRLEAAGEDIIHLEIGEPDFPTPEPIKEAAARSLAEGDTHYTSSLGKLELREEIAAHYFRKYRVSVSPEQIIVTSGTSPAMLLIFAVLLNKGEEVILPDPHYACYPNFIRFLDGRPVFVPVNEENGFKYRRQDLLPYLRPTVKAVMINSPANPTGAVFTADELRSLAEVDQFLVSDEIYHGLVYEGEEHSILEYTDRAFVINGFSKLYAMTGWRLGYLIAPREYIRPMLNIQQNLFICAPSFAQTAAIAALRECETQVAEMVRLYDQRRRYLLERLKGIGIATRTDPVGAFYTLANVRKYTDDSLSFAFEILNQAKLALTPGIDFGSNCEGYLRFSYANSLENIKEGLDRLEGFLSARA